MQNWIRFESLIKKAKNIIITTHIFPDADGIGSQISLCAALKSLGKNVNCVNEKSLLERYHYLDPNKSVISYDHYIKNPLTSIDLVIIVDTNSLERIGPKMYTLSTSQSNIIFVDHHPCAKELLALHLIEPTMAATGQLISTIIERLKISFTKELALPLYTAILIDTSSFRYPSVNGDTHRMIATLLDTGISPPEAYNQIYGAKKISYMHLLGKLLSQASINKNQDIAWICLTNDVLNKFNVDPEDTHAFINHLLVLENIKVAVMFRELDNYVKISMRSGVVDVGILAQSLGGGGHNHSAATVKKGTLKEVVKETINKLELMLNE